MLPSGILIFSRFCEPLASLPAKQGNNTKQNKSQLHEVSGVGMLFQACCPFAPDSTTHSHSASFIIRTLSPFLTLLRSVRVSWRRHNPYPLAAAGLGHHNGHWGMCGSLKLMGGVLSMCIINSYFAVSKTKKTKLRPILTGSWTLGLERH